jgi:hypothetical protein
VWHAPGEAEACLFECVEQVTNAIEQNPTEAECHESYCTLDQLDPGEPYGPVVDGACPSWNGSPQLALEQPLGLPGSVCAPPCSGLADVCPDHPQTAAEGICYLIVGNTNYCVSLCYVDPTVVGGSQCQCGATCQPTMSDGEGNLRGICTFE